ncbi:MAG TPA: N-formylglutamate deformylase [Woeseiaceae bacterium]|nr:N-formylglutamate deformylase [Woeseiaceae bacterium]
MSVHETYSFQPGDTPLLVSVPHDGREIPDALRERMSPAGLDIPDTDWHVARLYDFAHAEGASVIVARASRYVVDLNRSASDEALYAGQVATGLCPEHTFAGDPIYRDGDGVGAAERAARVAAHWRPYHERLRAELDTLRRRHGYALLWDAHSIPGRVPRLFEGELPVLNIGTFDGRSCHAAVGHAVAAVAADSDYESVVNGRFKGGFITRQYGAPDAGIEALQLEVAQRSYMDEATRIFDEALAGRLRATLSAMLHAFCESAGRHHRR